MEPWIRLIELLGWTMYYGFVGAISLFALVFIIVIVGLIYSMITEPPTKIEKG